MAALLCVACETKPPSKSSIQEATLAPALSGVTVTAIPSTSARPEAPTIKPLATVTGLVDLEVPGYGSAVVSLPLGATTRKPVIIATHGNYDRPEWQCEVWRGIIGERAFVLCPRGIARTDSPSPDDIRFTYETNAALERELEAGLLALAAAYPDYVDSGSLVYTGFSLGAIMGVTMAGRKPSRARRLVLIEGGHAAWKPDVVKAFAESSDGRVLFVCSQSSCEKDAQWAAVRLRQSKVPTRIVKTKDVGHRYDGLVADAVRNALPWVVEGDVRFREPTTAQP